MVVFVRLNYVIGVMNGRGVVDGWWRFVLAEVLFNGGGFCFGLLVGFVK